MIHFKNRKRDEIETDEMNRAEKTIIRIVQRESFLEYGELLKGEKLHKKFLIVMFSTICHRRNYKSKEPFEKCRNK